MAHNKDNESNSSPTPLPPATNCDGKPATLEESKVVPSPVVALTAEEREKLKKALVKTGLGKARL